MFVKYPEKGRVKSRLGRYFDEDMIVRLYRAFIEDMLERLSGGDYQFRIACHPRNRKDDFRREFGNSFTYFPQKGRDLGEKMKNAFNKCFSDGFHSVAIIGSDIPDLPRRIVEDAFQALEKNMAAVGPSLDGGYYLIGFSRESFAPEVFDGIEWGTDSVCKTTVGIIENSGLRVHLLPAWRDIDRPEDIEALIRNSVSTGFAGSRTISCLRGHGSGE